MDALRLLSRSSRMKFGTDAAKSHSVHDLPSSGANDLGEAGPPNKKRKRENSDDQPANYTLNESDVRRIQKQNKIKITDLHFLSKSSRTESRKVQKEASRLFPQPLQTFAQLRDLKTNGALVDKVAEQAFREPTEVQMATIPMLLNSDDKEPNLLTVAPTGSGKTLAFMIPLINKIAKRHQQDRSDERHVSAIILAPTKELVSQIVNEGRKLTANTGVRIAEMRKGMKLHEQDATMEWDSSSDDGSDVLENQKIVSDIVVKSDILVSTPLSLVNVLTPNNTTSAKPLPAVQNLVLDEADVLLDPIFRDQTLAVWDACSSPVLRLSLWSATIGASIEELAISKINSHQRTQGHNPKQIPLIRTIIGLKDTSLPSIGHRLTYASTESGKLMGLRQLLHPARSNAKSSSNSNQSPTSNASDTPLRPPFIIFTQTITRAQSLYEELQYDIPISAGGSSRIAVLHSSLSSKQRSNTMTAFRQGKIWILITTDLLSRGVDFKGVNGIVNYDIPTTAASYVHRAGRTGRAGRKGGIAVTFYTRDDVKYLKPIANIIAASTQPNNKPIETSMDDAAITTEGLPSWLIPSLPLLTKQSRKTLKRHGVAERQAIKKSDDHGERRRKLQNRIGTQSGYERKLRDRESGMIQGSKRRKRQEGNVRAQRDDDDDEDDFNGFGD